MKPFIAFLALILSIPLTAQDTISNHAKKKPRTWNYQTTLNAYFFKDDYITVPVVIANHGWLHLESRFNYERLKTISFFGGYNFTAGSKVKLVFTPMAGFAIGNIKGIIPASEVTLTYGKWRFYNESEWLISTEDSRETFFYGWAQLTYAPADWFYFGIAGQRTRLYQTALDYQRGVAIGFIKKKLNVSGYLFNEGFVDPFFLISACVSF